MPFHQHRFDNGLQMIGESLPAARSVAIGFFVRTGARDETPDLAGVSHFLEHMVFKGTPRRTALDVNRDFDRIGAKYNAYTSEEFTVYYAAVLPEYVPEALDILTDILRPSLRTEDFDLEKQVILEEIEMYNDQPGSAAMELARAIYYQDHPLGHSILGTPASVTNLTREQMAAYFSRRYGASNILVVAAGKFDWPNLLAQVGQATRDWFGGETGRADRRPWSGQGGLHVRTRAKVQQEYVLALTGGPPAASPLSYAADCLAVAVGDTYGSRLYWALVDPGLAEDADLGYYEYDGCGTVCASYTCDPEQAAPNLAILRSVLSEVQRDGLTAEEFDRAKSKIASRIVRGNEVPMGRMSAVASAWLFHREYRDVDTMLAKYEAVTLADVRRYMDEYPLDRLTVVAFGPLEELEGVKGEPG